MRLCHRCRGERQCPECGGNGWRAVPGLGDCASCGRRDLPLRLQVSGAYSLCVRCEEIARAELSEVA